MTTRCEPEDAIERSLEELERRVAERTAELTRANEQLRTEIEECARTHQIFTAVIEGTDDVVFVKDREGRYLLLNSEGLRLLGKTWDEVRGRTNEELFGPEAGQSLRTGDLAVMESGELQVFEETIPLADGPHLFLSTKTPLRDGSGRIIGACGTARDITRRSRAEAALRESEKKYRNLVETSHDLIWSVDAGRRWTFLNRNGARAVYGCEPEDMLGRPFQAMLLPENAPQCLELFERIEQGTPVFRYESEHLRKDGSTVILSFNAIRLTDSAGHVVGTTGTAKDITERKRAEAVLARKQAELLHVSRLNTVGQMAAAVSHEIAQPLSAVSNFASACSKLLADEAPLDRQALRLYVDEVVRQSLRAGAILQWLRDFSRKSPPRRITCDLGAVLRDAVELTADDFRRREIRICWEIAGGLPSLSADPIQLQQMAVNLLTNAGDALGHLEPSRRIVTIRCRQVEDCAVLEFEDRGAGIPPEMVDRLFEPFATSKPSGMGMGLSICRTIVAGHGGEIEARSNAAGGATLEVRLPLQGAVHGH